MQNPVQSTNSVAQRCAILQPTRAMVAKESPALNGLVLHADALKLPSKPTVQSPATPSTPHSETQDYVQASCCDRRPLNLASNSMSKLQTVIY